jgi:hypothetical protein
VLSYQYNVADQLTTDYIPFEPRIEIAYPFTTTYLKMGHEGDEPNPYRARRETANSIPQRTLTDSRPPGTGSERFFGKFSSHIDSCQVLKGRVLLFQEKTAMSRGHATPDCQVGVSLPLVVSATEVSAGVSVRVSEGAVSRGAKPADQRNSQRGL